VSVTCSRCDHRHLIGLLVGPAPAAHAHILGVGAVSPAPDPVATVEQRGLGAVAAHVVQQDETRALAEPSVRHDLCVTPAEEEVEGEEG